MAFVEVISTFCILILISVGGFLVYQQMQLDQQLKAVQLATNDALNDLAENQVFPLIRDVDTAKSDIQQEQDVTQALTAGLSATNLAVQTLSTSLPTEFSKGGVINGDLIVNGTKYSSAWSSYPDNSVNSNAHSEIANDVRQFKELMIVGNRSGGGSDRRVGVWDTLDVHGATYTNSNPVYLLGIGNSNTGLVYNSNVDGPVVFGATGGNLNANGTTALSWDKSGSVITNGIKISPGWSSYPDNSVNSNAHSEIANDVSQFQQLMIVGNRSAGASDRRVGVWDTLDVHGTLIVDGPASHRGSTWTNNNPLYLRSVADSNTGLAYDSTVDGPAVFGASGGKLAASGKTAASWDNKGNLTTGPLTVGNGSLCLGSTCITAAQLAQVKTTSGITT